MFFKNDTNRIGVFVKICVLNLWYLCLKTFISHLSQNYLYNFRDL